MKILIALSILLLSGCQLPPPSDFYANNQRFEGGLVAETNGRVAYYSKQPRVSAKNISLEKEMAAQQAERQRQTEIAFEQTKKEYYEGRVIDKKKKQCDFAVGMIIAQAQQQMYDDMETQNYKALTASRAKFVNTKNNAYKLFDDCMASTK